MNAPLPYVARRDSAAIVAVKDGIAAAYAALGAALPVDAPGARARWQESHGALCIVAHPGLIRLSEEAGELLAQAQGEAQGAAVKRAGEAILAYLDHLAAGLPERPMRLMPAYRALLQARGVEQISAVDLFHPDLGAELPARPAPVAAAADALRAERRRFEAALLSWLKNAGDTGALEQIHAAVAAVEASRPAPGARAPWCAALGVLEALKSGALRPELELRRFVSQLNMQICRAIDGPEEFPEALFRQALYLVAGTSSDGLAGELRRAYALDGMLDDGQAVAPALPEAAVQELKRLHQAWSGWTAGEAQAESLRAAIGALERASAGLGAVAPADLLAGIYAAMRAAMDASAATGKPDAAATLEISCALLMLENFVEDTPLAAASFAQRAANARTRLQAGGDRDALRRLPPMELLDARARGDEAKQLLSQALAQTEGAIGEAEAALQACFADAGDRTALVRIDKPLAQCAGLFAMLQDEPAAAAIGLCRAEIAQLAGGGGDETALGDRLARRLIALATSPPRARDPRTSKRCSCASASTHPRRRAQPPLSCRQARSLPRSRQTAARRWTRRCWKCSSRKRRRCSRRSTPRCPPAGGSREMPSI